MAFDDVYDRLIQSFPEAETVVADAAYKTHRICKKVSPNGQALSTAYERPVTMKDRHLWWAYAYDEYYDCMICRNQIPSYRTTNRDRILQDSKIRAQCSIRRLCTRSKNCVKIILRHIWKDYEELTDDGQMYSQNTRRFTPDAKK